MKRDGKTGKKEMVVTDKDANANGMDCSRSERAAGFKPGFAAADSQMFRWTLG